jgi:type 1 glutamine amidotransferase
MPMKRLVFQTGGPWHPLVQQAEMIRSWLPAGWQLETAFAAEALDQLENADLFIAAGMVWPELDRPLPPAAWEQAGIRAHPYTRPTAAQKEKFRRYVASGRPLLAFHGGILCFEDWPEYGRLLGFRWDWGYTGHSKYGPWTVTVQTDAHPIVAGVRGFAVHDELYFNVVIPPEAEVRVHAKAPFGEWVEFPMVMTIDGEAGRISGAGRSVYLANGHTVQSLEPPAMRQLWLNALRWLLE